MIAQNHWLRSRNQEGVLPGRARGGGKWERGGPRGRRTSIGRNSRPVAPDEGTELAVPHGLLADPYLCQVQVSKSFGLAEEPGTFSVVPRPRSLERAQRALLPHVPRAGGPGFLWLNHRYRIGRLARRAVGLGQYATLRVPAALYFREMKNHFRNCGTLQTHAGCARRGAGGHVKSCDG